MVMMAVIMMMHDDVLQSGTTLGGIQYVRFWEQLKRWGGLGSGLSV